MALSVAEQEVVRAVLVYGVKLAINIATAARARGVNLDELLVKAQAENEKSIFEALGIDDKG
jgi:hypothetical protein